MRVVCTHRTYFLDMSCICIWQISVSLNFTTLKFVLFLSCQIISDVLCIKDYIIKQLLSLYVNNNVIWWPVCYFFRKLEPHSSPGWNEFQDDITYLLTSMSKKTFCNHRYNKCDFIIQIKGIMCVCMCACPHTWIWAHVSMFIFYFIKLDVIWFKIKIVSKLYIKNLTRAVPML